MSELIKTGVAYHGNRMPSHFREDVKEIVDADMDYVNSLDSKALKAHLDHTAPKFPAHAQPAPHRESDAAVLTAEEEKIVRTMHLDRQKYIEEKKKGI